MAFSKSKSIKLFSLLGLLILGLTIIALVTNKEDNNDDILSRRLTGVQRCKIPYRWLQSRWFSRYGTSRASRVNNKALLKAKANNEKLCKLKKAASPRSITKKIKNFGGCAKLRMYKKGDPNIPSQTELVTLADKIDLTEARNEDNARCTDGSTPAIYYRPGSSRSGKKKFMIYFNGGGWCAGTTPGEQVADCWENCIERAKFEPFGTSTFYEDQVDAFYGQLSPNKTENPTTYDWNLVIVPLCDGTSYTGNLDEPIRVNDEEGNPIDIYFRGFAILNGVFKYLIKHKNFNKATDVVIGGCSAGGLNIFIHADYISNKYIPNTLKRPAMFVPDSGVFPEENIVKYIDGMKWIYNNAGVSKETLNKRCFKAFKKEPWKCLFAQNNFKFIKSKTYILQSQYDGYNIGCGWGIDIDLPGFDPNAITTFGRNLFGRIERDFLKRGPFRKNHAAYIDSCERHCEDGDFRGLTVEAKSRFIKHLKFIRNVTDIQAHFNFYYKGKLFLGRSSPIQYFNGRLLYQDVPFPCDDCCPELFFIDEEDDEEEELEEEVV